MIKIRQKRNSCAKSRSKAAEGPPPKDSAISGFVRGKSVIGREGLANSIEFSPEFMDLINLCENMHVGSSEYKLKGMVCYNGHFTSAVLTQGNWTHIDDLCAGVKEFCSLATLKRNFAKGWFFVI